MIRTRASTSMMRSSMQGLAFQPAMRQVASSCSSSTRAISCSPAPAARPCSISRRTVSVQARYGASRGGGGGNFVQRGTPEWVDRFIAAAPYLLPFLNSFTYARFLYHAQPMVRAAFQPLIPAITQFHSIPFANFIAFFGIYLGLVQNRSMSRFVKFNAVQAILLDILLVLPRLVEVVFSPPMMGWGKQLYINLNSALWMFVTVWVAYGICTSLLGQYGRIPFIAEAADEQIR